MNVWIDVDSTLTDPKSHCKRLQENTVNGIIYPSAWNRDAVLSDLPAIGAWEGVFKLNRAGYKIHYLTARYFENAENITRDWLKQNSFCRGLKNIHIVKSSKDKAQFLRDNAKPGDLFIDDMS